MTESLIVKQQRIFDALLSENKKILVSSDVPGTNEYFIQELMGRFVYAGLTTYCKIKGIATSNPEIFVSHNYEKYNITFMYPSGNISMDLSTIVYHLLGENFDIDLSSVDKSKRISMANEIGKLSNLHVYDIDRLPSHGRLYKTNIRLNFRLNVDSDSLESFETIIEKFKV